MVAVNLLNNQKESHGTGKGKLSDAVNVAAGTTVGIITVAASKKVYVKSIIAHAAGTGIATATGQVYFVPNGGSPEMTNKIFDVDIFQVRQYC